MTVKKHTCTACPRKFRTVRGLLDHMRDSHGAIGKVSKLAREKSHQPIEPHCIECGKLATLTCGEVIYPHRPDLWSKRFYRCDCGAYCGCHPNTIRPLGFPCGPETRKARSAAHAAFDPLWRNGSLTRWDAYEWLASALGIDTTECHIGMMTAERARQVVALVEARTEAMPSMPAIAQEQSTELYLQAQAERNPL